MRLLANENVPRSTIGSLRNAGFDVASILEDSPGISDHQVLNRAATEGRVILTFDKDYGDLIFRDRMPAPPGVILARIEPISVAEATSLFLVVLRSTKFQVEGWFSIVTRDSVRQRRLP